MVVMHASKLPLELIHLPGHRVALSQDIAAAQQPLERRIFAEGSTLGSGRVRKVALGKGVECNRHTRSAAHAAAPNVACHRSRRLGTRRSPSRKGSEPRPARDAAPGHRALPLLLLPLLFPLLLLLLLLQDTVREKCRVAASVQTLERTREASAGRDHCARQAPPTWTQRQDKLSNAECTDKTRSACRYVPKGCAHERAGRKSSTILCVSPAPLNRFRLSLQPSSSLFLLSLPRLHCCEGARREGDAEVRCGGPFPRRWRRGGCWPRDGHGSSTARFAPGRGVLPVPGRGLHGRSGEHNVGAGAEAGDTSHRRCPARQGGGSCR